MAVTATSTLYQQSEKVRPKLEAWLSNFTSLGFNKIKNKNVEKVSERDFRIPFKTKPGGKFGTYDPNAGSIGRGSAAAGDKLVSTFFPFRLSFELSQLEMAASDDKEKAIANQFKETIKVAIPEFAIYLDKLWHRGDGTGVVGVAEGQATVSSKTVYTLTSSFGAMSVRRGMPVRVMPTAQTSYRTDSGTVSEFTIEAVDVENRKVTLSHTVASAANDDVLVLAGSSGNSPTGMKGLPYFNDYTTSGTTLGINRANEPEIWTPNVNANGGISRSHGVSLLMKHLKRRGMLPQSMIGFCPTEVYEEINKEVQSVQRVDVRGESASLSDLTPKVEMEFKWCGVTHFLDPHQNSTRIDWINPEYWGWASLSPTSFWEVGGQRFLPIYASDGAPAAAIWFGLTANKDSWCSDPAQGGVIYGITTT